ncbi:MAG: hypothetical protein C4521_07250 [Actinobacteria bacterium]|nr:MAG: hypothetical protein C4521_07250 [Actinomycetota bacterium]
MPVEWHLQVLEAGLKSQLGEGFVVRREELLGLMLADGELFDEIMKRRLPAPVVVLDAQIVCSGRIDMQAISRAITQPEGRAGDE